MASSNVSFQFFPRGCRPDSVFLEDCRVFTIEGITNLPKMKQRSDRKGFHFLNHKRTKIVTTFGILFVQKRPVKDGYQNYVQNWIVGVVKNPSFFCLLRCSLTITEFDMFFFNGVLLLQFILTTVMQIAYSPLTTTDYCTIPFRKSYKRAMGTVSSYNTIDGERQKRLNTWLLSLYNRQVCINDSKAIVVFTQAHCGGFGNAIRGLCTSMLLVTLFDTTFKRLFVWML